MKKVLFSLFLICTFASYALYVEQTILTGGSMTVAGNRKSSSAVVAEQAPTTYIPPEFSPPDPTPTSTTIVRPSSPTPPPSSSTDDQLALQAQGQVHISNAYASAMTLVKTTRLLTADGKLFHIAQTVLVPAHGQATVDVYADKNGSAYAIAPTTFSVPALTERLKPYVTVVSDETFVLATPVSFIASAPAVAPTHVVVPTKIQVQPSVPTPTPEPTPVPMPDPTPPVVVPPPVVKPKGMYRDGTYTGDSVDAYYGNVQVAAVIQDGKIADVQFLDHPQDRNRSIAINNYAMPNLTSEAIQAQSANVDGVSGATATSRAFVQSLQSALAQALN